MRKKKDKEQEDGKQDNKREKGTTKGERKSDDLSSLPRKRSLAQMHIQQQRQEDKTRKTTERRKTRYVIRKDNLGLLFILLLALDKE